MAGWLYRNLLDSDELERIINLITILVAEPDDFPHALHQRIERFRLRVAASQRRNGGHVVTFFIAFDHDREFPLGFHYHFPVPRSIACTKTKTARHEWTVAGESA